MMEVLRIPRAWLSRLKGGKHALLCLVEQKLQSTSTILMLLQAVRSEG